MKEDIRNYNEALQVIYDHVGFKEDWVVFPIDDCMEMYWRADEDQVVYAESQENCENEIGTYYSDEIYKQRFYSKWVYEGADYTMIFCDPRTDGMRYFRIFDNTKRIK